MSNPPALAEQVSAFAASARIETLPADVVESVKLRVLDTVGIAVAATGMDTSEAARRWAIAQAGSGTSSAIGVHGGLPASLAAFVNGVLAHSLDFDDTHLPSVLHPSASVVPAVLAVAEQCGSSGGDLITAIAVGLEVCVRLGMAGYDEAAGNSTFFEHGQHATAICGTMGAAVAVAMLLGRAETAHHALGVAASMASGIIESNRTGGTVKRLHCGWAAHSAIAAAELVSLGVTGPPTVLEGRFGFFQAWLHGDFDPAAISDHLGERWHVPDIFFKPYPANHFTHAAVDAGRRLRDQGVDPRQVRRIVLGVPAPNLRTIGEPIDVKRAPLTGYMAQFSGPYAVAVGLLGGGGLGASREDYTDELATDPQRRALMAKIEVVADEECTKIFPRQFPAVLTAELTDGRVLIEKVLTTRGGPERPLSAAELAAKFDANVGGVLSRPDSESIISTCQQLERATDVRGITLPLRHHTPIHRILD